MGEKSNQGATRRVRKGADEVQAWLDKLDEQTAASASMNARRSDRYEYRVCSLVIELEQSALGWVLYEVPTRNLSREGVSFLIGHFVYPNTACRVHLISLQGQRQVVPGKIVRCRYLEESGSLHEVGVHFDSPIDVGTFNLGAARLRFLMIDNASMHRLVGHLLKTLDVELTHVEDGRRAIDMVMASQFDLVLLDMELPDFDGFQTARELRKRGYARTIVAFTALTGDDVEEECVAAGCNSILAKPVTLEALAELLGTLKENPITSTLGDDPEIIKLVNSFIMDLPERVGKIESAFSEQDFAELTRLVRMLKGEGGAYGFQPITDLAIELEKSVMDVTDTAEIRTKLNELIKICLSARSSSHSD